MLVLLRRQGAAPCHQLHYLQMVTEKLGKAYFWRAGTPSQRSHAVFVKFMRRLGGAPRSERRKIAEIFSFRRFADFQNWLRTILPLAYDLERLAPALAEDGPNPEYPWPRTQPEYAPVTYEFDVWNRLIETGHGRQLMQVVDAAVRNFPVYG